MRIAAVGGSGFVGRHVVALLAGRGHELLTIDRRPPAALAAGERWIEADLSDPAAATAAAFDLGPSAAIVWLAASIRQGAEIDEAAGEDVSVMVETPLRFLEAVAAPPASLVYLSTIQVYGAPERLPVREDHPTRPFTAYGAAKLAAEAYLRVACRHRGTPLALLRLAFVYGPGQHPANALPRFLEAIRRGEAPTLRGDGREIRDDVYVGDVARAVAAAIDRRADGVFNIASGRPHTLLDVAETACRVAATTVRPRHAGEPSGWLDRWYDVSRAREALGWAPETSFEEGVTAMWRTP